VAQIKVVGQLSGKQYSYVDSIIGAGGMKDVYFSPDKSYVIAFFREKPDATGMNRLKNIVDKYRHTIFDSPNGAYWNERLSWPTDIVESNGRIGIVAPTYDSKYFFAYGSKNNDYLKIKGREKEGKWFASSKNRSKHLDSRELGELRTNLRMCLELSRAVRKLHAVGLAHSDLSYKNVLVDPISGSACMIDIDGLVVPGIFPPDVVGTPDFIAPEVVSTQHLSSRDPNRKLPSVLTDRHALAVLIYLYLLYRHPLRGGKLHDNDPIKDEELMMGAKALFIEHPSDRTNQVKRSHLTDDELPWADPSKMPMTILGPYLANLFNKAFVEGLHEPSKRPSAAEWEEALIRTLDLIQPCANKQCQQKQFIFDNTGAPVCPLCKTPYKGKLPILDLYSKGADGQWRSLNRRVMVWDGQSLFHWHVDRLISPNENLPDASKKRVGYFQIQKGSWVFVNESLSELTNTATKTLVPIGGSMNLENEGTILFGTKDTNLAARVTIVN
jgi:serine/threonine protein kinase